MKTYSRNQVLSSLIDNPPYNIDYITTAPRVSKLLTFPFGLRIDSYSFFKLIFKSIYSMSLLMVITSVCIISISLPLQVKNIQLSSDAKSLANQKLGLVANLQETTNYNKLFSNAAVFSLKDTEENIVLIKNKHGNKSSRLTNFKNYPPIQFSGF